jgi:hypothetical protein
MKAELEKAGCRVSIHSKSTHSSLVDNKIRQLKAAMRSVCSLPYLFPTVLVVALVAFCVSKINMTPSRANYHSYFPHEILLGRPKSVDRDLGGKGGNGPLQFGSRVEIFERTSNTMADRTTPAIFLGSKGTGYGSALFFKLANGTIVSSDQWKALPMDAGTIARMNEIAKAGHVFPGKLPIFFGGKEVTDEPYFSSEWDEGPTDYVGRVVVDSGREVPTGAPIEETDAYDELKLVTADTIQRVPDDMGQLFETRDDTVVSADADEAARRLRFSGELGGDTSVGAIDSSPVTSSERFENRGDRSAYHHPVGAPWFLSGAALAPSEGRPQ